MSSRPARPASSSSSMTITRLPWWCVFGSTPLRGGHGTPHEGDDLAAAVLVKLHAIEESFDYDESFSFGSLAARRD